MTLMKNCWFVVLSGQYSRHCCSIWVDWALSWLVGIQTKINPTKINLYPVDNAISSYLSAGWWFIRWIALFNVWTTGAWWKTKKNSRDTGQGDHVTWHRTGHLPLQRNKVPSQNYPETDRFLEFPTHLMKNTKNSPKTGEGLDGNSVQSPHSPSPKWWAS